MSESVSLNVTGMKCGGCESNVKNKLQEIAGVLSVSAKHKDNKVDVEYDTAATSLDVIKQAIVEVGYTVDEE